MKRILLMAAILAALLVPSAQADNYGTTPAQYAKSKALVLKYFGNGWKGQTMVRCMRRESGGNPLAANYRDANGGSYGLLQLNGVHRWRGESLRQFQLRMWNPHTHLQAAVRLARGGLGPWGGGC